jgi:nitroimidazol reductase NimA-like FMN-containing flavoprotein (pyridoxamine 5'-phosphate oxidase superfamily)
VQKGTLPRIQQEGRNGRVKRLPNETLHPPALGAIVEWRLTRMPLRYQKGEAGAPSTPRPTSGEVRPCISLREVAMEIREMTEQECRAMMTGENVVRLACARNNQPYIVPIHLDLDLDGNHLYGYATLGQKIEWMRENPLVCLEIDELTSDGHWASVVISGHYEELPRAPQYETWRKIAEGLFQRHPVWWEPASVPLATHDRRAPIVFRIRIDSITGRRGTPESRRGSSR